MLDIRGLSASLGSALMIVRGLGFTFAAVDRGKKVSRGSFVICVAHLCAFTRCATPSCRHLLPFCSLLAVGLLCSQRSLGVFFSTPKFESPFRRFYGGSGSRRRTTSCSCHTRSTYPCPLSLRSGGWWCWGHEILAHTACEWYGEVDGLSRLGEAAPAG